MHSSTEDFKSMKSYDVYKCLQWLELVSTTVRKRPQRLTALCVWGGSA